MRTNLLSSSGVRYVVADLPAFAGDRLTHLPWIHRIILENLLRHGSLGDPRDPAIAEWMRTGATEAEIEFFPGRVMMHDTTFGPAFVDIAAARDALTEAGGDPARLNAVLPVDVSTDHSIAVDQFGSPDAFGRNFDREMERNRERYEFMKWVAGSIGNVTVHPPGTGIMHTINLERLATVVRAETRDGKLWAVPDTLIGTDSHTPMINGIGVLGWGVGGLEAESVILGGPVTLRVPRVLGVRLTGKLRPGVLATDLALDLTHRLREIDPGNRFVEFFGPGVSTLSVGPRAVVANMAPEYGASSGYFAIDRHTIDYLLATGRSREAARLVEDYAKQQSLWFDPNAEPAYDEVLEVDLHSIGMTLAGPRRPQDRLRPEEVRVALRRGSSGLSGEGSDPEPAIDPTATLPSFPVAIAAITSCTNTTDPRLLVAAGLAARKARALGLARKPWVKTSLAPGSPASELYLRRSGLLDDLEAIGFAIVAFGCTTCIGNSGELTDEVVRALELENASPVAVLSGNRNFPGRVHGRVDDAFLASPPLVVAYAIAGDADRDIARDPIGLSAAGVPVRLADIWPSDAEIDSVLAAAARTADYAEAYGAARNSLAWTSVDAPAGPLFPWNPASTYIRRPPFASFASDTAHSGRMLAHPLMVLGDDVTTDQISPAGAIPPRSEAGSWLVEHGENPRDLNVYSSRRGNWEVMLRGLFTNRAVVNLLDAGLPPGFTIHAPSGEVLPLWRAAERYREEDLPVVLLAGERYGAGSSRDWAAKGLRLLGVRAVLAASFERIHRSNLVNMGILPLRLPAGVHPSTLAPKAGDRFEIDLPEGGVFREMAVPVVLHRAGGTLERFTAAAAIDTTLEAGILEAGGIIPLILRRALEKGAVGTEESPEMSGA